MWFLVFVGSGDGFVSICNNGLQTGPYQLTFLYWVFFYFIYQARSYYDRNLYDYYVAAGCTARAMSGSVATWPAGPPRQRPDVLPPSRSGRPAVGRLAGSQPRHRRRRADGQLRQSGLPRSLTYRYYIAHDEELKPLLANGT